MQPQLSSPPSPEHRAGGGFARFGQGAARPVLHAIGVMLAAVLAYAIWRAYQNPDLLLDLSAWRLC